MSKNYEIDNVDLKILNLLMEDAKIPYTEVAKKVFVSGGTVHVRMKKLEEMGVVNGTTLKICHSMHFPSPMATQKHARNKRRAGIYISHEQYHYCCTQSAGVQPPS